MRLPVTGGFPCSARAVGHRLVRDYPPPRAVSRPTLSTRAPRGRCGVGWVPDRTPADRRDGDSLHDSLRRDRTPRLVPPKVGLSRKQVGNPPKRGLALAEGGTEASNRDPPTQAALGLLPHGGPGAAGAGRAPAAGPGGGQSGDLPASA